MPVSQQNRDKILIVSLLIGTLAVLVNSQQQQALQNVIEHLQPFSYEAPDDCKFSLIKNQDISLACKLRTVNSEFDTTNFSVIPVEHTTSLTILCNHEMKVKSLLKPRGFAHLLQLNELNLEYCKFSKLQSEHFAGLDLWNLSVRTENYDWPQNSMELDANLFEHLRKLVRVDLSTNNIWSVPANLFCSLAQLKFLNMSMNSLSDINELGFRDRAENEGLEAPKMLPASSRKSILPTLGTVTSSIPSFGSKAAASSSSPCTYDIETLDLSFNNFVILPPNGFGMLRRLKTLKINNNDISMLNDKALSGLRTLKKFDLSSNRIVAIPPDFFKDQSASLESVLLGNNSISALSPGLFGNLKQLNTLDFSYNKLTSKSINNSTFRGLIRLVLLDLSSNEITRLDSAIFSDLYTLQILSLRNNLLENIEADTFSKLANLHKLLLSHNKIKYLDAYSLNGLSVLSFFAIDNNVLTGVHPEAFRNCSMLHILNINGNQLTKIPLALKDMRLLGTLDLGENLITTLDEPGFHGLDKLYGLRLIGNQIENISRTSFRELPALEILNLAKNHISFIESGTFEESPSIEAIRLDGNFLSQIDGTFNNMKGLVWLNVSDNNLTKFDYSSIPVGLKWLDIHKNNLTELTNVYGLDDQLHLQTLDASFNRIEKVTASTFPNTIELLFLNDNLIHEVEPHAFLHKTNLTRVDLYANRIVGLDMKSLRLMPFPQDKMLPEFYIGGNPFVCDCNIEWLKAINEQNSRQYPRIMDIDTIYCKLLHNRDKSFVPLLEAQPHHFLCSYNLHCFALCECCGRDSCDCEMKCPANCTCFHDQTWKTNIVECVSAGYRDVPKSAPNDVTELYLDGTNLVDLNANSFVGKKNLLVFYGNNSNINIIQNGTFAHLQRLFFLHLGNNKLQRLTGHEFNSLDNLKELYLQKNQITFIDTRTFQGLKKLQVIRLDNNKLINFEIWQLTYNPYLVEIALANNPWSCDCNYLHKIQIYLQSNTEKVIDFHGMACEYNNYTNVLREKNGTICTLKDGISSMVYSKQIEELLPFLLLCTCVFVGFFGLIFGLFCYRRQLKFFILDHCMPLLACCGYKTTEFLADFNDKDRLYDAYVIYSMQDENFVAQGLSHGLENDIGYRLCLHYRDFTLNANTFIADTICDAIDNSKRAIMVLSKNFLYNEWGRFEFKGAVHEILKRRRKLIIVLYGDIPQRDLDADIRLYLKSNLCIEWDDKKFWQKLRLAMPSVSAKHTNKNCRSTINIYATAQPPHGGLATQYPLVRPHDYNTLSQVNRIPTMRRGVGVNMPLGLANNGGPASIRLDNYGTGVINNCQQNICDNYEQINYSKFNTIQASEQPHHMNRRMHEYAVPTCTSGGLNDSLKQTNNCMLTSNESNYHTTPDNFECNKYTASSTSSLSNSSAEFCARSLSSPGMVRHHADDLANENLNADDVFFNNSKKSKSATHKRDNINNLNSSSNNNNINCKTMSSSGYYCSTNNNPLSTTTGSTAKPSNNNNTMSHHHHHQMMSAAKKLNIVDDMKNSTTSPGSGGSTTTDKKRRMPPQSDMMWA